jgi:hypothetical protein
MKIVYNVASGRSGCKIDAGFEFKRKSWADMFRRLSIALLAATVSVPLSTAQRRGAMGMPVSVAHAGFGRGVKGGIGLHHRTRPFTRRSLPGLPFLYSDYDASEPYLLESNVGSNVESDVESASPQVLVSRSAVGESPRRTRPLLIEWQGDRYVRFGGLEETEERGTSAHPDYAEPTKLKLAKPPMSATPRERTGSQAGELPSAVLVYRDGHREEIPDYAIADGVIYVHGNYWQNGYGTKHIPLSALDPPATIQANQQRGVKFMLPSASNVVIASF